MIDPATFDADFHDATELVPWAEPNHDALQHEGLEEAVLRGLDGPIRRPEHSVIPILRFADQSVPSMTLMGALVTPAIPRLPSHTIACDLHADRTWNPQTLWVPCGQSVVQVMVCPAGRAELDQLTSGSLVWS